MTETVDGVDYRLAAEVGLLSRNVKIVGQSYGNQDKQAFGARVVVGKSSDGTKVSTGRIDDDH